MSKLIKADSFLNNSAGAGTRQGDWLTSPSRRREWGFTALKQRIDKGTPVKEI